MLALVTVGLVVGLLVGLVLGLVVGLVVGLAIPRVVTGTVGLVVALAVPRVVAFPTAAVVKIAGQAVVQVCITVCIIVALGSRVPGAGVAGRASSQSTGARAARERQRGRA